MEPAAIPLELHGVSLEKGEWKGRGSQIRIPNRFERFHVEPDPDADPSENPKPETHFYDDSTRSLITYNKSPDLGFSASLNPYRGCEHGCSYCYARPTHEYLGMSAGIDFETKIMVKRQAPDLLRKELESPRWTPQVLVMSGVTDCYQPVERKLQITRGCLEVLAEFRNPVALITKNALITRDIDVFQELHRFHCVVATVSITTLRGELGSVMEPRAAHPLARLRAVEALAKAGIPVGVNIAPIIPGLNDYEVPAILKATKEAGAHFANYVVLRLPWAVSPLFQEWLERHLPESKEKILHRIQSVRGGKLYRAEFGTRMKGEGLYAEQIARLFRVAYDKVGFPSERKELSTASFRKVQSQLELFSE